MTPSPKEKAKELVEQYMDIICPDGGALSYKQQQWHRAKQCAIIACQEIINTGLLLDSPVYVMVQTSIDYWNSVKTEIEKL